MPPKKNPVKPKGKMTAYAFFVNACRLEHHNQFPGQKIKLSEFSTVCAKRWKEMTMDQKRPFAEMADRDKMRYENELKLLFPGENQPKRRRKKKDPNAPKKNLSPFFIFSKLKRPEIMKDHPSKGVGEISKVLSAEWSNMSEEDKAQYVRLSEEDKVRYQKQLEQYKETGTTGGVGNNMMVVPPGVDDDDDEEEDDEDEFSFPGGHAHSGGQPGGVQMTSAQSQFQQGQQSMMAASSGPGGPPSMVTSTVQQGASQSSVNNQQFANGQAQMYQPGMMMQPQGNMMGGQGPPQQMGQFSAGNNQMQQMMQPPQQTQSMQGQMHPNYTSQSNHQQFMNAPPPNPQAQQQQPARMMQSGPAPPQQMQQPQQTQMNTVVTSQNQNQQQFMMSMSNGPPPRGNASQFTSQPPPQMMQMQPQQQMQHQQQQSNVEVQQQMHANQLMQQAAAYQQQQQNQMAANTPSVKLEPRLNPTSQSQMMPPQTGAPQGNDDMQESIDQQSNLQLRPPIHQTSLNGPTPPPQTADELSSSGRTSVHTSEHYSNDMISGGQSQDGMKNGPAFGSTDMNGQMNQMVTTERQTPPKSESLTTVPTTNVETNMIPSEVQDSSQTASNQEVNSMIPTM